MSGHVDPARLERGEWTTEERPRLLEHLRTCSACRASAAERDPTLLFGLLGLVRVPVAALDRLQATVHHAVAREAPRGLRAGWREAASLAASLLLAATFGAYLWNREPPAVRDAVATLAPVEHRAGVETLPVSSIELLAPRAAELVRFQVGREQLTMIFDSEFDL